MKKPKQKELRILMAKALDVACKKLCENDMMEKSFSDVGLTLNIDGSKDYKMDFQGQKPGKLENFDYSTETISPTVEDPI